MEKRSADGKQDENEDRTTSINRDERSTRRTITVTTNHNFQSPKGASRIERVAVDVEGVLAATQSRLCAVYNKRHGTSYEHTDINHWDWVTEEIAFNEFMSIIDTAWCEEDCGASITTWGDSTTVADAIDRLQDRFAVDIVTARTGVEHEMQAWLATRDIEYDTFHSISYRESKAELGYDIYIDDKPGLADELATDQLQYLVKRPWNQSAWDHHQTITTNSLIEAAEHLLYR